MDSTQPPESGPSDSARRMAYPWRSAQLEEVKSWRQLPASTGRSLLSPKAFHLRAMQVVGGLGFELEEEPPDVDEGGAPVDPTQPMSGAVQGERAIQLVARSDFQSDMVWVAYDSADAAGPTAYSVRAAQVQSSNFRSRHGTSRSLSGLGSRPDLDALRDQVAAAVGPGEPLATKGP